MPVDLTGIIKNVLDVSTIDPTRYVAPYRQTRWVALSSLLFLGPSIYGYNVEQYFLAVIALITSFCSVNFWRDATYSYRRKVDCIMAKIAFTVFTIQDIRYVSRKPFIVSGYLAMIGIIYCYYMSNKHADTELWWKYHMMFHLFVSCGQFISIKSVADYESCK